MRGQVKLDPRVQAKLLEQMREEQQAAHRGRMLRRYLLLPLTLGAFVWSGMAATMGEGVEFHVGGLVLSSLGLYMWRVRKRVPAVFGFD
jgi:hypothetical protein